MIINLKKRQRQLKVELLRRLAYHWRELQLQALITHSNPLLTYNSLAPKAAALEVVRQKPALSPSDWQLLQSSSPLAISEPREQCRASAAPHADKGAPGFKTRLFFRSNKMTIEGPFSTGN